MLLANILDLFYMLQQHKGAGLHWGRSHTLSPTLCWKTVVLFSNKFPYLTRAVWRFFQCVLVKRPPNLAGVSFQPSVTASWLPGCTFSLWRCIPLSHKNTFYQMWDMQKKKKRFRGAELWFDQWHYILNLTGFLEVLIGQQKQFAVEPLQRWKWVAAEMHFQGNLG